MGLKIEYTNVPTGSMENSTTTATNPQSFVNFNDFHTQRQVPKYATLEEGRNILDGTFINFPSNPSGYGYLSTIMTDENGDFPSNIVITRTYPNNYTSPGLSIEFDSWTDDYPRTMNVKWYRDTTLLSDQTYNVDSALYFCDNQVESYNKIVITIGNMTKANRFLKIFNIYDGITRNFYDDELQNVQIIEQVNPTNKALSINQAKADIYPQNTKGVQFQRTLPFMIYKNEVLYGKFYIDSSKSNTNKTKYNLTVNDSLSILEGQTFNGAWYVSTLVSTAISNLLGSIPYNLNSTLGNKRIYGYLPITNKREALRQIAFAIDALIDTSRSDAIEIKPLPTTSSATIGKSKIISISRTEKNIITEYNLTITALKQITSSRNTIFSEEINGDVTVIFDKPYYQIQISGGTIVSNNNHYAIINGSGTVTLTGIPFDLVKSTYVKSNPYTTSTDIAKTENFNSTVFLNNITTKLNNMKFVKYEINAVFKMENVKVGDIVTLDGEKCRIIEISYDLSQKDIYCKAKCEVYYE